MIYSDSVNLDLVIVYSEPLTFYRRAVICSIFVLFLLCGLSNEAQLEEVLVMLGYDIVIKGFKPQCVQINIDMASGVLVVTCKAAGAYSLPSMFKLQTSQKIDFEKEPWDGRSHQRSALPAARRVQWMRDCCQVPIPKIGP